MQRSRRRRLHEAHGGRHARRTVGTTQSPLLSDSTARPTSRICPSASCPSTRWDSPSGGRPSRNAASARSVPHTPTSCTRNKTSRPSTNSGSFIPRQPSDRDSKSRASARIANFFPSPRNNHQREAPPGQESIDTAPEPYSLVEEFQRRFVDARASQQLPEDPPRNRADLVELMKALHLKPRSLQRSAQLARRKPPLVSHRAIERSVQSRPLRHQDDHCPARLHALAKRHQYIRRSLDRFEHVHAKRALELLLPRRVIRRIIRIELADRHIRRAQETIVQRVQNKRVFSGGHVVEPPAHQAARKIPQARSDLEDRVPQVGPQDARQPAQVLWSSGETVEQTAAVGRHI